MFPSHAVGGNHAFHAWVPVHAEVRTCEAMWPASQSLRACTRIQPGTAHAYCTDPTRSLARTSRISIFTGHCMRKRVRGICDTEIASEADSYALHHWETGLAVLVQQREGRCHGFRPHTLTFRRSLVSEAPMRKRCCRTAMMSSGSCMSPTTRKSSMPRE